MKKSSLFEKKFWKKFLFLGALFCIFFTILSSVYAETDTRNKESEKKSYTLVEKIPLIFSDVMAKIFGDHTLKTFRVQNTSTLHGKNAEQLLKRGAPCEGNQVIVGIREDGIPRCGSKIPMLVRVRLQEGSATVQLGNEPKTPVEIGKVFSISTNSPLKFETKDNEAVLQFVDDKSIIRMDKNTLIKVSPTVKNIGGIPTTIAQATLNKGLLWGRVLGSQGMNFENNTMVAGVRGTSITVMPFATRVVDTQNENSAMEVGLLKNGLTFFPTQLSEVAKDTIVRFDGNKVMTIPFLRNTIRNENRDAKVFQFTVSSDSTGNPSLQSIGDKLSEIEKQGYIAKFKKEIEKDYTKADLAYMNELEQESNIDNNIKTRVRKEILATEPKKGKDTELCENGEVYWKNVTLPNAVCLNDKVFAVGVSRWNKNTGTSKSVLYYNNGEKQKNEDSNGTISFPNSDVNNMPTIGTIAIEAKLNQADKNKLEGNDKPQYLFNNQNNVGGIRNNSIMIVKGSNFRYHNDKIDISNLKNSNITIGKQMGGGSENVTVDFIVTFSKK